MGIEGFYDRPRETLDREGLRRLQEQRLSRLLGELEGNRFYRRKWRAAGVDPGDVGGLEELSRLPFTTKDELVEAQRHRPPYGDLPTYPPARYRYIHQTSGTSGEPLLWLDTAEDWETWLRCWGQVYRGAGVGEEDVVFAAFSFGPYVAHWSALEGARAIGALGVSGGGMGSKQRLRTLLDRGCTVLVSTPTYALHLGEVAAAEGLDLASSAVRVTLHAGEPGASVPNVKRRIEEIWGARCFDHAGATEVGAWGFDCLEEDVSIHLNELEFVFEVVDPDSGEPLTDDAPREGSRGELVVTSLGRPGMPVVRYRTGDLVERTVEPCPCGRHMARLRGGVLGRCDDMVVVRGVNLYPSAVDNLVRAVPEVVEYEVEIRRVGGLDDLRIEIETAPDGPPVETVERTLRDIFRSQLDLRIEVAHARAGSLPRYELKARRFKRLGG